MKVLLSCFAICLSSFSLAQEQFCTINGRVLDSKGIPVKNAFVYLIEVDKNTTSNNQGFFEFDNLKCKDYSLYALYDNRETQISTISLSSILDQKIELNLMDRAELLDNVVIQTKAKSELLQHAAIKADVINVSKNNLKANSIEDLISRAPGVKVRNVGGLGASSNIIVGGFTGNAIKFLYDDIPIDYLGSSYGLTKVPTNMVDHIEVYKGVLPTKIGTDALGSAINIVPVKSDKTTASLSYETGSYATSIVTLNAHFKLSDAWHIGTNNFYNYSKNNFKVNNLPVVNNQTGSTTYIRSKLFHNSFEQGNVQFYVQGRSLIWADWIELTLNSYELTKDIQNDAYSRARAFGQVYRKEQGKLIPSIKYKKTFLDHRLALSQFLVYSKIDFELFDKAKNVFYDWNGEAHSTTSSSEMGNLVVKNGHLLNTLKQVTSRTHLNFLLSDEFQVESNTVYTSYTKESNIEQTSKTFYDKLITTLALNASFFDKNLESNTQIKYLYGKIRVKSNLLDYMSLTSIGDKNINTKGFSFAQAFKYSLNKNHYIRVSYENTYRLPDQEELFGDNNFIVANYGLEPEKSNNLNFGYTYSVNKFQIELNTYYRDTKDLIRLKDLNQYQATFLNLDHVKGIGIELDGFYKPLQNLLITANLTWNDFRLQSSKENILNNQHYKKARIANMPFYYTNVGISYNFKEISPILGDFSMYWNYSYIHQYYLDFIEKQFEPDGFLGLWGKSKINTNRIIPVQHLNNVGTVYQKKIAKNNLAISAEIKNIFNYDIFNEFKMQSPGRNYRLKLTYSF